MAFVCLSIRAFSAISSVFSIMCNDETVMMLDNDPTHKEYGDMEDEGKRCAPFSFHKIAQIIFSTNWQGKQRSSKHSLVA